jgi:ribosomal-protein-alanine N-acetyltransferase
VTGPGRVHLVAEEAGRLIGHGGIVILDGDAHISTIAVESSHQRRGIGDVLMKHLLGAAASSGCAAVTLEVRASNAAAIALYERHGMVSSGVRPGYYVDNGEDALIMWNTSVPGTTAP